MKRLPSFFLFSFFLLSLSGCNEPKENPDAGFDDFYQGSPQEFESAEPTPDIPTTLEDGRSFEFSGGNESYQCTTTCTPR